MKFSFPWSMKKNTVPDEKRAEIEFTSEGKGAELLISALNGSSRVTADTAMQVPSIARCVNMIAGAVAMLPIKLYRRANGNPQEITDDPRVKMLNTVTGDTINADQMRYAWVRDYLLNGSAYAVIERRFGIPDKLYYVPENEVGIMMNKISVIHKHYTYNIRGEILYPYQVLKILRCSDGFGKGTGIVQENPLIIDTAYNMLKFQKIQLSKGGSKKGFLTTEQKIDKKAMDEVRDRWAYLYGDPENSDRVMLLNSGITFKEISSTPTEMQLNENMRSANTEIMKLFGTNDGVLSDETVKNAVMPILDVMEAAFDSDLLLEEEKDEYYFAFDTREFTRGNMNQRYSAYEIALKNNIMQLDEVRALEDLPKLNLNFMKLGLQDVLLDPETMLVYTPNTNQVYKLNEKIAPEPLSEGAADVEQRFNPNHDPENGQFTTTDSERNEKNSSKPLDKSEKSGIIKSYDKISALGENKFQMGFSKENLDKHWGGADDHSKDYSGWTKEQYAARALELVQSAADGKQILGYKTPEGAVVRFDVKTGDYVKGYPKTGIATMFKPDRGKQYFHDRKRIEKGVTK